jgi:hypothetical protein
MNSKSKPKKTKETGKWKIHFEESECGLHIDIDENELYDDDFSRNGYYFTDRDMYLV